METTIDGMLSKSKIRGERITDGSTEIFDLLIGCFQGLGTHRISNG